LSTAFTPIAASSCLRTTDEKTMFAAAKLRTTTAYNSAQENLLTLATFSLLLGHFLFSYGALRRAAA